MRRLLHVAAAAVTVLLLGQGVLAAPKIRNDTLTVSGVSAGAAMAIQYHIANSATVNGAGIIAGLPYYCSTIEGIAGAYECMDDPMLINVPELNDVISALAQSGSIDAPSNLKNDAVMLFSGIIDTVVNHGTMELVQSQYAALGVTNLITYFNYTAEHAWITNYAGSSCASLGSPYINNCGLDFAGEFLKQAFKQMGLPFNNTRGTFNSANLMQFSQTSFGADTLTNSLDSIGYYYVPTACQSTNTGAASCQVHVNFHGCEQGESTLGTIYVTYTGLNEWAESNNVIILYPQASANLLQDNPNGCFDWWGYTGSNYVEKQGVQMQFVQSVLNTLMSTGTLPAPSI